MNYTSSTIAILLCLLHHTSSAAVDSPPLQNSILKNSPLVQNPIVVDALLQNSGVIENTLLQKVIDTSRRVEDTSGLSQSAGPECALRKKKGSCSEAMTKYYYDTNTKTCKTFTYTGCNGNLNNFQNIEFCNSRCVCSRPKDEGRGNKRLIRYFYNKATERCEPFTYRGSKGNGNRFKSQTSCESTCERERVRQRCRSRPKNGVDCNNNSTIQYYYDRHCDCCRKFTYLGCDGNRNRFPTEQKCLEVCQNTDFAKPEITPTASPKPNYCYYQPVYGDCNKLYTRFYHDSRLGRCIPFTYSGCGGNENNFISAKMCQTRCERRGSEPAFLSNVILNQIL